MDKISIDVSEGRDNPRSLFDLTLDHKSLLSIEYGCLLNRSKLTLDEAHHLSHLERQLWDTLQGIRDLLRKHRGRVDPVSK